MKTARISELEECAHLFCVKVPYTRLTLLLVWGMELRKSCLRLRGALFQTHVDVLGVQDAGACAVIHYLSGLLSSTTRKRDRETERERQRGDCCEGTENKIKHGSSVIHSTRCIYEFLKPPNTSAARNVLAVKLSETKMISVVAKSYLLRILLR